MSTQSVVRVEFIVSGTAYELCAVGGWFEKSWKIRSTQDLHEPPPGYLAADAWFYPLGAATAEITFAIEEEFSSHSAAQAAFNDPDLFGGVSLLAATGTLRVTAGGTVTEWGNAVLADVNPTMPSGSVSTVVRAFAFRAPAVPSMA